MAGRERILIGANDSLERVLDLLRSSRAEEVVLDVDERSALLLNLDNLDSLEGAAKGQGVRLTIASTSSRVLSVARLVGLPVIDTTAIPQAARRPDPNARLLAGEPLGGAEVAAPGGVAVADAPPPEPPKPERAPLIAFSSVTVGDAADEAADDGDGWDEDEPASPPRTRASVPPARTPRLDPYGQPYADDEEDDESEAPAPRGRRTAAPPRETAALRDEEEGWSDDLTADDRYADDDPPVSRPGLLGGLSAFWNDVRERVAVLRRPADEEEAPDEDDSDAPEAEDDGWDEPPYQARHPRPAAPPPAVEEAEDEDEPGDTGELPPPIAARPTRTIRPLTTERSEADRQPTARLRPIPAAADDEDEEEAATYIAADRDRRGAGNGLVWALIAVLALALVALLVAYLVVPRATVTLVARTNAPEIAFDVVVAEIDPSSPQGQPTNERIVVPARRIVVPVSASVRQSATGVRLEPDVTAGGPVVLANTSRQAVSVPKGTVLRASDGRNFITMETVAVPPNDFPNSAALGTVTVKVAAERAGSGGNAAIGAVQGELANGILYSNRDAPIAGGSDRRLPTIARADLAAAQAAAEEAARGKWSAALAGAVPPGSQAMRETAGLGPFRVEFSAKEGADGDSVTATVTADATSLVYTPGEVESRARAEAERRIGGVAKPGESIVPGSIQIGTPQPTGDVPGTLTYRMTASARTRAAIGSDAERAQLARDLAHQSDDAAHDTLARLPGVSSATIDYDTGPFPRRMPWLASHIEVRVAER